MIATSSLSRAHRTRGWEFYRGRPRADAPADARVERLSRPRARGFTARSPSSRLERKTIRRLARSSRRRRAHRARRRARMSAARPARAPGVGRPRGLFLESHTVKREISTSTHDRRVDESESNATTTSARSRRASSSRRRGAPDAGRRTRVGRSVFSVARASIAVPVASSRRARRGDARRKGSHNSANTSSGRAGLASDARVQCGHRAMMDRWLGGTRARARARERRDDDASVHARCARRSRGGDAETPRLDAVRAGTGVVRDGRVSRVGVVGDDARPRANGVVRRDTRPVVTQRRTPSYRTRVRIAGARRRRRDDARRRRRDDDDDARRKRKSHTRASSPRVSRRSPRARRPPIAPIHPSTRSSRAVATPRGRAGPTHPSPPPARRLIFHSQTARHTSTSRARGESDRRTDTSRPVHLHYERTSTTMDDMM